jgi:hypothetical protein
MPVPLEPGRRRALLPGFLLLTLFLSSTPRVMAMDYFVSTGGDDTAAGRSEAHPWRTIARVQ